MTDQRLAKAYNEAMEEIVRLEDEVARLTAVTQWRPIETAPDDGQIVIICGGRYLKSETAKADGGWWRLQLKSGSKVVPTHWMPLPEGLLPAPPTSQRVGWMGAENDTPHAI